ncbi:MAG: radical SAM protein [Candidatus Omnitrophota bacterium]|nr:MAG: radical SAM protein [Candidatus Omnitrophota bacterium]
MKYIYGPVNSRRLGLSLGLSLVPYKTCTFDCIYCQLGRTTDLVCARKEYLEIARILDELKFWLENNNKEAERLNFITLSGMGESALNNKIGALIQEIKDLSRVPLAVITNSSLINLPSVRQDLLKTDLIVPSLDAAQGQVLKRINSPHTHIKIEEIINGLINLRKEFKGKIWLEIMLVKGVNDDLRHIKKLKEIIEKVNPDKIHLNSPIRTAALANIATVDKNKLKKIQRILGEACTIL